MNTPFQGFLPNMKSLQEQITKTFGATGLGNTMGSTPGNGNMGSLQGWPFAGLTGELGNWLGNMGAGNSGSSTGNSVIPVDVLEAGDDLIVVAELPGLSSARDISLSVYPDHIVISGQVERAYGQSGGTMHVSERSVGSFERTVTLPVRVKRSAARAKYHNGLLEVRLVKNGRLPADQGSSVPIDFRS